MWQRRLSGTNDRGIVLQDAPKIVVSTATHSRKCLVMEGYKRLDCPCHGRRNASQMSVAFLSQPVHAASSFCPAC